MSRPLAVQFGAGSVGRGFLGQLLTESGYEVLFVDVRADLIAALDRRGSYPLRLVSDEEQYTVTVSPVRALDGRDFEGVASAVAAASLVSTAVGGSVLPQIAGPITVGLMRRDTPVNLLICENLPHPAATMRDLLVACGGRELSEALGTRVGLAPCVISRMVPLPDPAASPDPLEIVAEPYARLPVDAAGLVGDPPPIRGLEPKVNFGAYVKLKLFVHNAGHAAAAYHGFLRGHTFVHEAMKDLAVASEVDGVTEEGCEALRRAEGLASKELAEYRQDIIHRFYNPYLGDTVARVGRDPLRKLAPDDRLVGGALLALTHGILPRHYAAAIAAALRFQVEGDPSSERLEALVRDREIAAVLADVCGLAPDDPLVRLIMESEI